MMKMKKMMLASRGPFRICREEPITAARVCRPMVRCGAAFIARLVNEV
ncbi:MULTISPECIES: hypothetical protein [unclassified Bradyrhizobium]|nr:MULTISPECIES: hypothetical protein [unclassified Bradyrhizobium]MCA1482161.1 hypothetical protein [Bradyrhizobium sp. IC4061]